MVNPKSLENLEKGRKQGIKRSKRTLTITDELRQMIDMPAEERWLEVEDKGKGLTYRQAIAKRMLIESLKGNSRISEQVLERLEGKVTQPISGDDGGPILIKEVVMVRNE